MKSSKGSDSFCQNEYIQGIEASKELEAKWDVAYLSISGLYFITTLPL
jgi:hypothetical protein